MPQQEPSAGVLTNDTARYIDTSTTQTAYTPIEQIITWSAGTNNIVSFSASSKGGITPQLYFKYIKKKFGVLENMKMAARLKRLEAAFNKAVSNGQILLGEKLMADIMREARESAMYAKGIKHFIEHGDLTKHKRNIRGGHISDTKYEDFTRVIPEDVLAKKKASEGLFDGYVIYHYWDEKAEKNRTQKQKMSETEKARMRDPVLFGVIRESNRLYFIADWEDDHCDLTFEEMLDVIGADEKESTIPRVPTL